jgi:hypothetical protein
MKSAILSLIAVAGTASAHYTFPELIAGGKATGQWAYVRKTANYQSNGTFSVSTHNKLIKNMHHTDPTSTGPVTDVTSSAIRCYELAPGTPSQTYTVNAGDSVGFTAVSSISHPGPLQFYMARVPSGKTAATFDGSGAVWFKVYSQGATFSGGQMTFASNGKAQVSIPIPKSLPSGEYLLRVEHIGLHSAGSSGGAQFYISCAQIKVEARARWLLSRARTRLLTRGF